MNNGNYIKINRSILNWEWYDDLNTFKLFIHLLLTVNWKDCKWRGNVIHRGQRVSSYTKLSEETGLSIKQVRGCLEKLKKTGEVAHQNCVTYGLFTVLNYDKYQDKGTQNNMQKAEIRADERQAFGQFEGSQGATIEEREESKEYKNKKDIVAFPTEKTTKPKFTIDSFEMLCVETLIHSCLELYPNSKVPVTQVEKDKWAIDIDRMKRLDNRTEEDIRQALEFAINNTFWKSNIRSTKKFREKFETLLIQSEQNKSVSIGGVGKKQTHEDFNDMMKGWLENE